VVQGTSKENELMESSLSWEIGARHCGHMLGYSGYSGTVSGGATAKGNDFFFEAALTGRPQRAVGRWLEFKVAGPTLEFHH